jgi:hypothetical protein
MKPDRKNQNKLISWQGGSGGGDGDGPITANNYVERARAFIKAKGEEAEGFVIRAYLGERGSLETKDASTPREWAAWMNYFEAKGIKHAFAVHRGMTTVPAQWPEEFDLQWLGHRPAPIEPPPIEHVSPDRRRALAAMLRRVVAAWEPEAKKHAVAAGAFAPAETPEQRLGRLAQEYAEKPLEVSEALRERISRWND